MLARSSPVQVRPLSRWRSSPGRCCATVERCRLGEFLACSLVLIAVLCVVLMGKGVSALQEAGWRPINQLAGFVRIEVFGVYPIIQGIAA